MRTTLLGLAAALAALAAPAPGQQADTKESAKDWPLFRGNPAQTGVTDSGLPEMLAVRWTFKGGDAFESTAAVVAGTVYAGCYDEHVYALNLADGKLKWKEKVGPVKAPVSVYRGAVYVGTEDGLLFCLDAAKGTKRWSFETGAEITGGANFAGDRVVFGSYDGHLYCLSTAGKLLWKVKTDGPINGSPAVAGGYTFVAGCDSHLHVLDLKNMGKQVASVDLEGQAGATAAVLGDLLYVGTMTNQVKAIDWKQSRVLWSYEPASRAQAFYASAGVTDGLVVVGSRDKKVHALDRKSGKPVWTFATKNRVDASPVVVGKRVYAPSLDGKLYVLDLAGGKKLQELDLGQGVTASPAVAEDCLVVGTTDGVLYCLGKKR